MELYNEHDGNKVILAELEKSRIRASYPIICCINTKDLNNISNWQPNILRKIRKETFEVLNMHERDKVGDDLDMNGDDGLTINWGMYLKYPSNEYVCTFVWALQEIQCETEKHDMSPMRISLHKAATTNFQKKADFVTKQCLVMLFLSSSMM